MECDDTPREHGHAGAAVSRVGSASLSTRSAPVALIGSFPPPAGGQAVYNARLIDELRARGVSVVPVDVTARPGECSGSAHARMTLAHTLLTQRYSMFHLTASDSRVVGFEVIVALVSVLRHTPFIYNILAGRFAERFAGYAPVHRWLLCLAMRRAAMILASNRTMADSVRQLPLLSRATVEVVGCKLPLGVQPEADGDMLSFLRGGDPSIVAVGSLRAIYGFDLLVRACAILARSGHAPRVLAIVSGAADPNVETALARELGDAEDLVRMRIRRDLPRAVVLSAVQAADVLVRPTRADGDSLSIHEAQALGTPVVASDVVPRPEGVVLHHNGDPVSLADAIRTARTLRREPLGITGETVVDRLLACYGAVAGGRRC